MVLPLRALSTSPGRSADPPGMFSVSGARASTFTGNCRVAMASMAANTAAAPDMSVFIVSMPSAVFSDRPPESNTMPLPTMAKNALAPGGSYHISTRRAGSVAPALTPRMPPKPPATRSSFS